MKHSEFRYIRRVEFSDTDMAGIVHFSRFFIFMETAEHAFYRSLGFSVSGDIEGHFVTWPRLEVQCQYKKPLRFEEEVEIHLLIREIRNKTIRYEVVFRRVHPEPVEEVARGSLTIVCITMQEGVMKSIPIPDMIRNQLEATTVDVPSV